MAEALKEKSDQVRGKRADAEAAREKESLNPPFPYRVISIDRDFFGTVVSREPTGSVR